MMNARTALASASGSLLRDQRQIDAISLSRSAVSRSRLSRNGGESDPEQRPLIGDAGDARARPPMCNELPRICADDRVRAALVCA